MRQLISENLQISSIKYQMSKGGITIKAYAMKSRPDILIVQGESVGGHENTRESREERNPGETNRLENCPEFQKN
jgi:hypothetical protein